MPLHKVNYLSFPISFFSVFGVNSGGALCLCLQFLRRFERESGCERGTNICISQNVKFQTNTTTHSSIPHYMPVLPHYSLFQTVTQYFNPTSPCSPIKSPVLIVCLSFAFASAFDAISKIKLDFQLCSTWSSATPVLGWVSSLDPSGSSCFIMRILEQYHVVWRQCENTPKLTLLFPSDYPSIPM